MRTTLPILMIFLVILADAPASSGERAIRLKDGPGKEKITAYCVMCHSLDYIVMNSPFLDRKGWEASVKKMIHAMGAPIPEDEAPALIEYLVKNYGVP